MEALMGLGVPCKFRVFLKSDGEVVAKGDLEIATTNETEEQDVRELAEELFAKEGYTLGASSEITYEKIY